MSQSRARGSVRGSKNETFEHLEIPNRLPPSNASNRWRHRRDRRGHQALHRGAFWTTASSAWDGEPHEVQRACEWRRQTFEHFEIPNRLSPSNSNDRWRHRRDRRGLSQVMNLGLRQPLHRGAFLTIASSAWNGAPHAVPRTCERRHQTPNRVS